MRIPLPAAGSHAAPSMASWTSASPDDPVAVGLSPGHAQHRGGCVGYTTLAGCMLSAWLWDVASNHVGWFFLASLTSQLSQRCWKG